MSKHLHFSGQRSSIESLESRDEKNLRSLEENELRQSEHYYRLNQTFMNITNIRHFVRRNVENIVGISDQDIARLETRFASPRRPVNGIEILTRERENSGLYKYVQATFRDQYNRSDLMTRRNLDVQNIAAAGLSAALDQGSNLVILGELERRFGDSPQNFINQEQLGSSFVERQNFVLSRRLQPALSTLTAAQLNAVAGALIPPLPAPASVLALIDYFRDVAPQALRDRLRPINDALIASGRRNFPMEVLQDLQMLKEIHFREEGKTAAMAVYDETRLNDRINSWRNDPDTHDMLNLVEELVDVGTLYPITDNPDGKALISAIEANLALGRWDVHRFNQILTDIQANEVPRPPLSQEASNAINSFRRQLNVIEPRIGQINTAYANIASIVHSENPPLHANSLAVAQTQRDAAERNLNAVRSIRPAVPAAIASAEANLITQEHFLAQTNAKVTRVNALITLANRLESEIIQSVEAIRQIERLPDLDQVVVGGLSFTQIFHDLQPTSANDFYTNPIPTSFFRLVTPPTYRLTPGSSTFTISTPGSVLVGPAEVGALNTSFEAKFGRRAEKLTAFQLLQRIKRREYFEENGMPNRPVAPGNPNVSNFEHEEADRYATIMATLAVSDVKNTDLYRAANKKIAEQLRKKPLVGDLSDKWAEGMSRWQERIGLQAYEFTRNSANSLVDQIIDSNLAFAPLKGLNKFSTPRDILRMISTPENFVSKDVLAELAAKLEAAVKGFQSPIGAKKEITARDWDLEMLVHNLRLVRNAIYSREFTEKALEAPIPNASSRAQVYLNMLRTERDKDEQVTKDIVKNAQVNDRQWQVFLSKNDLLKLTNKSSFTRLHENSKLNIAAKEKEIKRLESLKNKPRVSPSEKAAIDAQIADLKDRIAQENVKQTQNKDLFDRVEETKQYAKENGLSWRATRKLFEERGLKEFYDKTHVNYKIGAFFRKSGEALTGGWNWFNKSRTSKRISSAARLAVAPITYPAYYAGKAALYPFKLAGSALKFGFRTLPAHLAGFVHKPTLRSYYIYENENLRLHLAKLKAKASRLEAALARAPFAWDRWRIQRQMTNAVIEFDKILYRHQKLSANASKIGLSLTPVTEAKP